VHVYNRQRALVRTTDSEEVNRRTLPLFGIAAFISAGVGCYGCTFEPEAAREARRVFAGATPHESGTCWAGSAQQTARAFETSCEVPLPVDWSEYKRWLRPRLEPRYHVLQEMMQSIAFSRGLNGDLYTVTIVHANEAASKTIRITFRSAPW
jgi:hypothetical protein